MAYKCQCCGYKFKKSDGNICPECFTSREETFSCDDFSNDVHSHTKYADTEMTDIQKQLEQERLESHKEKIERSTSPSTMKTSSFGNRSTNFGTVKTTASKSTTFAPANKGTTTTYTTNSEGTRTTTTYTTNYSSSRANPLSSYKGFNMMNNTNVSQKSNKIVKIIVIIFVLSFILPIIFGFVGFFFSNNVTLNDSNAYESNKTTFSVSIPEIDIPDIDMPMIPVITKPEVENAPYTYMYSEETNYYDKFACVSKYDTIVSDDMNVKFGIPTYVAYQPVSYDSNYMNCVQWPNKNELYTVEVPVTYTNKSGERINVSDLDLYMLFFNIDEKGEIIEEYFSNPLSVDDVENSIIEDGVTYTVYYKFAVPVAHYYTVVYEGTYNNDGYTFYTDYKAEEVFAD